QPTFFSSGLDRPLGGLFNRGGWRSLVGIVRSIIPAGLGLDALPQLTRGQTAFGGKSSVLSAPVELEILLVLAIGFLVLARYALAYLELLAKREGKLTSRHQ